MVIRLKNFSCLNPDSTLMFSFENTMLVFDSWFVSFFVNFKVFVANFYYFYLTRLLVKYNCVDFMSFMIIMILVSWIFMFFETTIHSILRKIKVKKLNFVPRKGNKILIKLLIYFC